MTHAISVVTAQNIQESAEGEIAKQEPTQDLSSVDDEKEESAVSEAEALAKRMVEDAIAHAVSAAAVLN